jgi:hypothetical protein
VKTPLGADLVIPALALAFAGYFFFSIAELAWEAKANGVAIGGILVLLAVVQVGRIFLSLHRKQASAGFGALLEPRDILAKRVGLVLITIVFIATLKWLGVTLGLLLALLASLWILGVRNRKALVLVPLSVAAAVYLLFIRLLQSDIPHGPVEHLMAKLLS